MYGFLVINKPPGITSHTVVARVRRLVGRKVKVGHAGTLDPAATGVLPVALGPATRLIEYLTEASKGYRALVRLGIVTTTDDAEGEVVAHYPLPFLNRAVLETALNTFRGTILQTPPMYAALHHHGQRLYNLARSGKVVERAPRSVRIERLELEGWGTKQNWPGVLEQYPPEEHATLLTLAVECSKGTYIRVLARDLGRVLGCGAHLAALERTFVGTFTLDQSIPLALLESQPSLLPSVLQPPETVVRGWPAVILDEAQYDQVRNGIAVLLSGDFSGEWVRAHSRDGQLRALLRREGRLWHPAKVLV